MSVWTTKVDSVTTIAAAHINELQTEKVDRDGAIPMTGALQMVNVAAPGSSPANEFQLYAADFNGLAGKSMPHFRDEAGVAAAVTPFTGYNIASVMGDSILGSAYFTGSLATSLGGSWLVNAAGVGGDNTDKMRARFRAQISTAVDCEYVVIMGGINDIVAGTASAEDIEKNLQAMYTLASDAGLTVVAVYITPYKTHASWGAPGQAILDAVNTWIGATATDTDYVIDAYSVLEDPAAADTLLAAYDSGDHLHPNQAGMEAIADAVYAGVVWTADANLQRLRMSGAGPIYLSQSLRPIDSPSFYRPTIHAIQGAPKIIGTASVPTVGTVNHLTADGTFATSSGWTAAGNWAIGSSKATCTPGAVTTLSGTTDAISGVLYKIVFTTADRMAGNLYVSLGAAAWPTAIATNAEQTVYLSALAANPALVFTPSTLFDGSVDTVSISKIFPGLADVTIWGSGHTSQPIGISAGVWGGSNIGIGQGALESCISGSSNCGMGFYALQCLVTGGTNVAIGVYAGNKLATGSGNVCIGASALRYATAADGNVAVGSTALQAITNGSVNVAVGRYALENSTTASYNVAVGATALRALTTGTTNVACGYAALLSLTGGVGNVGIGYQAGYGATATNAPVTDNFGILIGYQANRSVASASLLSNYIGIGYATLVDKSNQVKIGNTSIVETVLYGAPINGGTPETQSGAGALDLATYITWVVSTGTNALTLADGAEGQEKIVIMKTDGGDATLTPAHPAGFATVAFTAPGHSCHMIFTNGAWHLVGHNGCTVS